MEADNVFGLKLLWNITGIPYCEGGTEMCKEGDISAGAWILPTFYS